MLLFSEFWLMGQMFLSEVDSSSLLYSRVTVLFFLQKTSMRTLLILPCFDKWPLKFFVVSCTNIFLLPGMI